MADIANPFAGLPPNTTWGARSAFAITPDDSNDMAVFPRAIYVGGAGNIAVVMSEGGTVTFTAVPVGTTLHICPSRVKATGTTATLLIGLR